MGFGQELAQLARLSSGLILHPTMQDFMHDIFKDLKNTPSPCKGLIDIFLQFYLRGHSIFT